MRIWLRNAGDCKLFWLVPGLVVLLIAGLNRHPWAASNGPTDWELASVVAGKDTARDVERKLGHTPCLMPNSTGDTISYLYTIHGQKGPLYLQIEINGHVDAMTVSQDPPFAGMCYATARPSLSAKTAQDVELGVRIEEIEKLYGEPTESFSVGPMARYRYVGMYDRLFEWDLVFRNGRLVEWTVATEE